MELFWRQGLQATTMSDLQRALGIGRQSLYNTFDSREALFEQALARYVDKAMGSVASLREAGAGLQELRAFMLTAVEGFASQPQRMGCFITQTVVEGGAQNEAIARVLALAEANRQSAFVAALTGAASRGEIAADADVDHLARYLGSQMAGLAVMARTGADRETLNGIVDTALQALPPAP